MMKNSDPLHDRVLPLELREAEELCRDIEADHVVQLPVLGVITTFVTNSAVVLDSIYQTYGSWAALSADVVSPSAATVRIIEHDCINALSSTAPRGDRHAPATPPAFVHDVSDPDKLIIRGGAGLGMADMTRGESVAWLPTGVVSHQLVFIERVLEPLTLFLLGALDRQPLHGAAIVRDGIAIILAGPSGAGKSTLSYAARALGFSILADEPAFIQIEPRLRVWGRRPRLHLPVEAQAHFPELAGLIPTALPNGKSKIVIESDDRGPRYADIVGLCLLRRSDSSRAGLARISAQRAVAELTTDLDPGYHLFADTMGDRVARIAAHGAWELTVTSSPNDALPFLVQIAAELHQLS